MVSVVTMNRMKQYVRLTVRCCTLVAKVGTVSQSKTMAGIIRVSPMVSTVNNVTICTVVMRVCSDVGRESGDKLVCFSVIL
jgi:hypothetical protein